MCTQLVQLLLRHGADPSLRNSARKTAHDVAATPEIAALLRDAAGSAQQPGDAASAAMVKWDEDGAEMRVKTGWCYGGWFC